MSPDRRICEKSGNIWRESRFKFSTWGRGQTWSSPSLPCPNRDVLCGFLLCVNISGAPRLGDLGGDISSVTFYHQGKELDCRCWLGPWLGKGRLQL